jgi:hypothetical protein
MRVNYHGRDPATKYGRCEIHTTGRSEIWHLKLTSYHGIFGHKRLGNMGELACILGVPCLSRHFSETTEKLSIHCWLWLALLARLISARIPLLLQLHF